MKTEEEGADQSFKIMESTTQKIVTATSGGQNICITGNTLPLSSRLDSECIHSLLLMSFTIHVHSHFLFTKNFNLERHVNKASKGLPSCKIALSCVP